MLPVSGSAAWAHSAPPALHGLHECQPVRDWRGANREGQSKRYAHAANADSTNVCIHTYAHEYVHACISGSVYELSGSQVVFIDGDGNQLQGFRFEVRDKGRLCLYNLKINGSADQKVAYITCTEPSCIRQ